MKHGALAGGFCLALIGLNGFVGAARAESPISAIDWLSHSLAQPIAMPRNEAPVTNGIATEVISVQSLDAPSPDGVGLLPRTVTGLPANLWGSSDIVTLKKLISAFPIEPLPAVQDQFRRLLLAELDPPRGTTPRAPLLQARVDALLARGAVEEAEALLERAGSDAPELFRRAFDVGLLTGREQAACARMRAVPGIAPSFPVRIFCLARTGDWNAAALTLDSAKALGQISPDEDALLAQFLDPELAEMLPPVAAPSRPSPLTFRMLEAIGSAIPTAPLPLAFAHSDLRPTAGWKARAEAAERLARAGALPPGTLFSIYGEHQPAASGGIWDRVAAVQALSAALEDDDTIAVDFALPQAWQAMRTADLEVPFARAFGPQLAGLALDGPAGALAQVLGLLSDSYEEVALDLDPVPPALSVPAHVARGEPSPPSGDHMTTAIAAAFGDPTSALPSQLSILAGEGRIGEALLMALRMLADGPEANPGDVTASLMFLRAIGLEETARRAALQILLLDRPA